MPEWLLGLIDGFLIGSIIGCIIFPTIDDWNKKRQKSEPIETDRDMTGAFAVADDNSLWLSTHQAINELEKEVIETARKCSANPSLSNYHLGASEGVTMVRLRLIEKRNAALKQTQDQLKTG